MKHIKLFESFDELNEGRVTPDELDALLSGNDSEDVLKRLKYDLLELGVASEKSLKSAKMISWTASEVKDLIKASENAFDSMETYMGLVDNGDVTLSPYYVDRIKAALKDKARVLQAVRSL